FTFLNPADAQPTAADNAAIALAATNSILGQAVAIDATDIIVDTTNQRVTVSVPRTGANGIPYYFGQALGFTTADVVAIATAEASPVAGGTTCLRPVFVPNTILSGETPSQACTDGQTILDASGNPSAWLKANPSVLGALMNIRPTRPSGALAPSQFYSIDFGGGANTYRCALASSLAACGVSPPIAACGNTYTTKNGNMVGPTNQGIGNLLGPTPDTWVGVGAYQHAGGAITDTSNQLIVAPVWDNCNSSIKPGKQTFPTVGFSTWFVEGLGGGGVLANFVSAAGCPGGSGGGGTGTGGNGSTNNPFGIPVRLVTP
ncbi:MAG: hypothetical protein ACRD1L_11420, partial [Terriglobales bacterium]